MKQKKAESLIASGQWVIELITISLTNKFPITKVVGEFFFELFRHNVSSLLSAENQSPTRIFPAVGLDYKNNLCLRFP
jgi:hypothetical protein